MLVPATVDEREVGAQNGGERSGAVSRHWETAAPVGAVGRKCANDDIAAWLERLFESAEISALLAFSGQEVKRGAIVPNVIEFCRPPFRRIGDNPLTLSRLAPSRTRAVSRAAADRSRTVMSWKPFATRLSTSRDAPPPTSMMADDGRAPTSWSSSRDSLGISSNQLTSASRLVV
jgi:hypothetical protein